MREIALAVGIPNKSIIDYLHDSIKTKFDFCKTIITSYCDKNFCYLLFACEDEFAKHCEQILRGAVVEYIENVYKISYLKEHVKMPIKDKLAFNAYIKVLSVFDKSVDIGALENIIMFNDTFFVDSFLEFRLSPLKAHWKNLAALSCDNISLFQSSTFIDIIKYLLNAMDSEVYKVKIVCEDGGYYKLYNIKNKNDRVQKIGDCRDAIDMISNVLNCCPNYVDIYLRTTEKNEAVSFLSNVFTNRLKIYSKVWE